MSRVYQYPHYYALGYRWGTDEECDFIEACATRWYPQRAARLLDIGCGAGRHALEMAARGYDVVGINPEPAMVTYATEQAMYRGLSAVFLDGSLAQLAVDGLFDAAWCFMDTFRFLLTDDAIIEHLRSVASRLEPNGLYILDVWVPRKPGAPDDVHDWEQRSETTHVRVTYRQYPETWDPAARTFEDELTFDVSDDGAHHVIVGGRTRTRLLLPTELDRLAAASGEWQVLGHFDGFDLRRIRGTQPQSWRMVTVLQRASSR